MSLHSRFTENWVESIDVDIRHAKGDIWEIRGGVCTPVRSTLSSSNRKSAKMVSCGHNVGVTAILICILAIDVCYTTTHVGILRTLIC